MEHCKYFELLREHLFYFWYGQQPMFLIDSEDRAVHIFDTLDGIAEQENLEDAFIKLVESEAMK